MKKFIIISISVLLSLSFNSFAQLKVNSAGNVGIGQEPDATYDLKLKTAIFITGYTYPNLVIDTDPYNYGRAIYPSSNNFCRVGLPNNQFAAIYGRYIYQDGSLVTSDKKLKENFRNIDKPLEKLLKLSGMKYDLIDTENDTLINEKEKQKLTKLRKDKLGFIAQDLEKIIPEATFYDEDVDHYYVDYNAIIPVVVEAMKEQQLQIEQLTNELANCCQGYLKSGSINNSEEFALDSHFAKLYQNTPNPFSTQTTIRYETPETVQNAQLHICNMTGTLLKTIEINQKGAGDEIISANEFKAGMYLYSLVCDGKIVDTKQMLLTE